MRGATRAMTYLCSPSDPGKRLEPGSVLSGEVTLGISEPEGQCPCRTSELGLEPLPLGHFLFLALLTYSTYAGYRAWVIGFGPCSSQHGILGAHSPALPPAAILPGCDASGTKLNPYPSSYLRRIANVYLWVPILICC